jgi:hypothetical protein
MSLTKVAFPPPPPTSNTLTTKQRHQLLRSTNKLGQVLGTTPQLLDESHQLGEITAVHIRQRPWFTERGSHRLLGPLQVHLPFGASSERRNPLQRRRNSVDSVSSSSCGSLDSTYTSSSSSSSRSSSRSPCKYSDSIHSAESWHGHLPAGRPPIIKLARSTPTSDPLTESVPVQPVMEMAPASPITPPPSYSSEDVTYTLSVHRRQSVNSLCMDEPNFVIPTDTSARREKMDRVKRKLGSGVPVDLVFPASLQPKAEAPTPIDTSIRVQRRTTVHFSPNLPTPPRAEIKDTPLDSIVESTEEHGASCAEEFGYPPRPQTYPKPAHLLEEVDIDLDLKLRGLVTKLAMKKRPWVRKGLPDSGWSA